MAWLYKYTNVTKACSPWQECGTLNKMQRMYMFQSLDLHTCNVLIKLIFAGCWGPLGSDQSCPLDALK
jgi:hypothetical protein